MSRGAEWILAITALAALCLARATTCGHRIRRMSIRSIVDYTKIALHTRKEASR